MLTRFWGEHPETTAFGVKRLREALKSRAGLVDVTDNMIRLVKKDIETPAAMKARTTEGGEMEKEAEEEGVFYMPIFGQASPSVPKGGAAWGSFRRSVGLSFRDKDAASVAASIGVSPPGQGTTEAMSEDKDGPAAVLSATSPPAPEDTSLQDKDAPAASAMPMAAVLLEEETSIYGNNCLMTSILLPPVRLDDETSAATTNEEPTAVVQQDKDAPPPSAEHPTRPEVPDGDGLEGILAWQRGILEEMEEAESGASGLVSSGPADPNPNWLPLSQEPARELKQGDKARYIPSGEVVEVARVHREEHPDPPYYTVLMGDGREKQTVWEKLEELTSDEIAALPPKKAQATAGSGPQKARENPTAPVVVVPLVPEVSEERGWQRLRDAKTGKTYFWNAKTQQTVWKRPVEMEGDLHVPDGKIEPAIAAIGSGKRKESSSHGSNEQDTHRSSSSSSNSSTIAPQKASAVPIGATGGGWQWFGFKLRPPLPWTWRCCDVRPKVVQ